MSTTASLGKVSMTPKGAHDSTLTYDELDTVTSNGSSYLALKSVPVGILITNTEYWQLIAQKGDTGPTGTNAPVVTSWSSTTSDSNVPSEKLVYDTIGDVETLLAGLR